MKNTIFFIFWFLACGLLNSVSSECNNWQTCNECIKLPNCAWCSKQDFVGFRCFNSSSILNTKCPEEYIFNPDNMVVFEGRDIVKDFNESGVKSAPHVIPPRFKVKLRQGSSYELTMTPKQPVDIYYLIDATSMGIENRNKIIYLSEQLTEYIPKISGNLKIGFGSFVDKVAAPFVDTSPKKLLHPCDECSAPYGFHHHLNMTDDMHIFMNYVRRFQKSGSLSPLNGGLDALMQTLACFSPIGWRRNSLKYVIFVTDSAPHQEGDGKQANITQLNDQNCHLDNEFYTQSSLIDYPSTFQINETAKENNINIIFAVTKSELQTYKNISQAIEGSAVIELNTESIDHVSSLVQDGIATQTLINMKHNSSEEIVSIKLEKSEYDEKYNLSTYKLKLEAKICNPNTTETSEIIQFYPDSEVDALIVEMHVICSCDCHHTPQKQSPYCSNSGTLECGICYCNENYFGQHCECANHQEESECIFLNNTEVCSGRGSCICGSCTCEMRENPEEVIYGKYCESDNYSCEHNGGKICSGHGTCVSGICLCQFGFTGTSCSCPKGDQSCDNAKTR
ncbi:unnamed protein product [Psylliodes chrysocephalus]|uniref:Integrin beta n=1 Tax=Psylliodes chrysocephalus TaxID=3402493 RepID=A0A9P0G808_9CUCU|nr:unnamed protein product [Psylliodes chrysocephala]